jgi:hypothetical protein
VDLVGGQGEYKGTEELQLMKMMRYKKMEEKSDEAKTSLIGHGSREVGGKTCHKG